MIRSPKGVWIIKWISRVKLKQNGLFCIISKAIHLVIWTGTHPSSSRISLCVDKLSRQSSSLKYLHQIWLHHAVCINILIQNSQKIAQATCSMRILWLPAESGIWFSATKKFKLLFEAFWSKNSGQDLLLKASPGLGERPSHWELLLNWLKLNWVTDLSRNKRRKLSLLALFGQS